MRISDWSSDVCSSDFKKAEFEAKKIEEKVRVLPQGRTLPPGVYSMLRERRYCHDVLCVARWVDDGRVIVIRPPNASMLLTLKTESGERSEEHTSELQSLMRISYAVFCLKKKTNQEHN